jgi:hypothetical protein
MATTVIGGMLAATIIGILLIPVTYYVVERFAANRKQRALHGVPRPREQHRDWNVILFAPTKLRAALREPSRFSRKSASRRCRGWPTLRAVARPRMVRAASVVALALALTSLIIASPGSTSIIIRFSPPCCSRSLSKP